MKIKHFDLGIEENDPFRECKLNRKPYAEILTNIVESYSDSFVLAIDNEWGTGKTTFLKMWSQELKNRGFRTLYFNAWENDFENDVLVALISELQDLKDKGSERIFNQLVKQAAPLTKRLLQGLVKTQIEKYAGNEFAEDTIQLSRDDFTKYLKGQIKGYNDRKKAIQSFKYSLEKFVNQSNEGKPLIFIIDELDRCRPNYSVEVLEQIKQLFAVNGIVFVLSIDKIQLCHAIRGVYGNENIDAEEYLRRFIDIEYSIPDPNTEVFCKYLYDYFQFDEFFTFDQRLKYQIFRGDKETFLHFSTILFDYEKLPLRSQEKIFSHARLTLTLFGNSQFVLPNLLILLIFLRARYRPLYNKIKTGSLSLQELIDEIEKILPQNIHEDVIRQFIHTEALLLLTYNNALKSKTKHQILAQDPDTQEKRLSILSRLDKSPQNEVFITMVEAISQFGGSRLDIDIHHLISKIDLISPISE